MTAAALWRPTWVLTKRAVTQLPRIPSVLVIGIVPPLAQFLLFGSLFGSSPKVFPDFPVSNYYTYIAPALVMFVAVLGIANAGVALVADFQSGYFRKVALAPVSTWSILLGRLLSDGVRIFLQAALLLAVTLLFGTSVATGLPGALVMLAVATLFAIVSIGVIVTNLAIKTKDAQAVQAIFPLFFILLFLTTAYLPREALGNDVIRHIVDANPAEYVLKALQGLMFGGWSGGDIGVALALTAAIAVVGIPLTAWNFRRSVFA